MWHRYHKTTEEGHEDDWLTDCIINATGDLSDLKKVPKKIEFNDIIRTRPERLSIPLKRRKPTVYAVWNDFWHESVPDDFQYRALEIMASQECAQHIFLVLTKRPHVAVKFFADGYADMNLDNVYHGLTVCNQAEADAKIPVFLQVPGKKYLSLEPMLGAIDLMKDIGGTLWIGGQRGHKGRHRHNYLHKDGSRGDSLHHHHDNRCERGIDAVILGGETGPGARPMHPDWVRSVRDQCATAGVPFFFKGWGEWYPDADLGQIIDTTRPGQCRKGKPSCYVHLLGAAGPNNRETDVLMRRVGKKASGRLLDGRTHDDLPWRKTKEKEEA
jgi:protein gp37